RFLKGVVWAEQLVPQLGSEDSSSNRTSTKQVLTPVGRSMFSAGSEGVSKPPMRLWRPPWKTAVMSSLAYLEKWARTTSMSVDFREELRLHALISRRSRKRWI